MENVERDERFASVESMQEYVNDLERQYNSYDDVYSVFVNGMIANETVGIKTVNITSIQNWFTNIDSNIDNIRNLLNYYFIANPEINQLYSIMYSLPTLNYKITTYKRNKSYENDLAKIRQALEKDIKYKQLTRAMLVQLAHEGTLIANVMGSKEPYIYIHDDLKYTFFYGTYKGKPRCVFDLGRLKDMKEVERNAYFESLKPIVTQAKYDKWVNEQDKDKKKEYQYVVLPKDKTLFARANILYNNQRMGLPVGTSALIDIVHKETMKQLERSIADRVMKALTVLKFQGKDQNDVKVMESNKTKVFNSVKKALEKSAKSNSSLSLIAIPDWASFEDINVQNLENALDPNKYQNINSDLSTGIGISSAILNGQGSNYSSAQMNYDLLCKKIQVLLEQIEPIYDMVIAQVLGENKAKNYHFEFTNIQLDKERLNVLMQLQTQGYSIRHVTDMLGIDFAEYITQSLHEIEDLKLRDVIIPNQSVYTTSGNPSKEKEGDDNNPNTEKSKTEGSNNNPSPSD